MGIIKYCSKRILQKAEKMSHRKFEHPRCGSLAYLPKRRTRHYRGRIRSFPRDDASKPVHLTAFMGYKAGMTHVVKFQERREGKKTIRKDVVHSVSVIECPAMKVIGLVVQVLGPDGAEGAHAAGSWHVADESNDLHGGALDDGHGVDDILSDSLLSFTFLLELDDVSHASLVAHEGGKVDWLAG